MSSWQSKFIADYNDKNRPKFNDVFFSKSDDAIIEDLKAMLISCQRDKYFTVKILGFDVIEDYDEVNRLLIENNDNLTVPIKDSYLKILKVTYYIEVNGYSDTFDAYIAVPRVFEGSYIILNGNTYFPSFQLVDGSTYNNTLAKSSKVQKITLKTVFGALRMIRNFYDYETTDGQVLNGAVYSIMSNGASSFKGKKSTVDRKVPAFKYLFAKYGFYDTLSLFGFDNTIFVSKEPFEEEDNFYTFKCQATTSRIGYVKVAKLLFDNDRVFQSAVITILDNLRGLKPGYTAESLFSKDYWIISLGAHFVKNNMEYEKGLSALYSLEDQYDIVTKKNIRLPFEYKSNIYMILRWMMAEFSNIRLKDNTDVTNKRIRWSEWIASLYVMKLNSGMYRLHDIARRYKSDTVIRRFKQCINLKPMHLISELQKSGIKGFRNMVNERDAILQLKWTFKGPTGPGETSNKNLEGRLKRISPSHLGILDFNTSSPTEPGTSGIMCPLNQSVFDGYTFTSDSEPNSWDASFAELKQNYRDAVGVKSAFELADDIGVVLEGADDGKNRAIYEMYQMGKSIDLAKQTNYQPGDLIVED